MAALYAQSTPDQLLQNALTLDLPYRYRRVAAQNRLSAVTLLFRGERIEDSRFLLVKRSETLAHHKGQIAFPGGIADPDDFLDQGLQTTALRELHEEVGIESSRVKLLGSLPELDTTTGFTIRPFVGLLDLSFDWEKLRVDPSESDHAFWVTWSEWANPAAYREERIRYQDVEYPIDVFYFQGHRVWGATGSILKNMLDRLRHLRQE
jgi:8-oxo-dGTP pyrophosphatase MutT (NUDIX family)